jgi:hypothetical protein
LHKPPNRGRPSQLSGRAIWSRCLDQRNTSNAVRSVREPMGDRMWLEIGVNDGPEAPCDVPGACLLALVRYSDGRWAKTLLA